MRHLSAPVLALLASLLVACGQPAVESVEEVPISIAPDDLPSNALAIVGTVVDYETGSPIPNALIQTSPPSELVLTTDRGEFVLQEGLFPGELYRVSARTEGYTSSEVTTHLSSQRHHVELPMIDQDRSLPLLFEPTTAVFTPSVHRIASSVRSRSNEPVSWELTSIPSWLQASSAEGSLQPFGLDWFELTLSDDLPAGQTDPLYGTLEFRDARDRIALLQVIAVPAPPELVSLSMISAETEVVAGNTTVLRAKVEFGDSPMAGTLAHLTIDGLPDGLIPTHSTLRSGADGEITAILVADAPGTYDLSLSLAAYPDSGTIDHTIEIREPPTPGLPPLPDVIDLQGPSSPTNQDSATFTFACQDPDPCTFSCELTGASQGVVDGPVPCSSPFTYPDLADDEYAFLVRVITDEQQGPFQLYGFTVDTTPPEILDLQGPDPVTNQTSATFSFGCDQPNCAFHCTLQGAQAGTILDQAPCTHSTTYPFLPDDEYTFNVVATDPAGNSGIPQGWGWIVDTVVPVVEDPEGPAPITHETSATFSFDCSKPPCFFTCELYGAAQGLVVEPTECFSGISFDDLDDDEYTFTVVSTDEAGNQSEPLEWHWEVDNSAPVIDFVSTPTPYTMDDWAFFEFVCLNKDTCTFECALDSFPDDSPPQLGDYEPCDDTWYLSDLPVGAHTLRVRATDALDDQGEADHSWTTVPPGWTTVSSRINHACGITNDRQLHCWGSGGSGRLGLGDTSPRYEPTAVTDTHDWIFVDTGTLHTCGIREDHSLWCWGSGGSGRLGLGNTTGHSTPQRVGEETWETVSAGSSHTCGIQTDGGLYCWGYRVSGRLGLGELATNQLTPQRVGDEAWLTVVAGQTSSCGIQADQSLWCWGGNGHGQLGQGSQTQFNTPQEVIVPPSGFGLDEDSLWLDVVMGFSFTCALRQDGAIYCFGAGSEGQMGNGLGSGFNFSPVLLSFDFVFDWTSLAAGGQHVCATRDSGPVHCWGAGYHGQTGHGEDGVDPTIPHPIDPDLSLEHLTAGSTYTCGIDTDDQLWCWGDNDLGTLGLGFARESTATPLALAFDEPLDQVSAGRDSACLIDHTGALYCWGRNLFGRLGFGDLNRRPAPQRVGTDHWVSVDVSLGEHTCAIRDDSSLWCWGSGGSGRLGLGSLDHASVPHQVDPGQEFLQVATGSLHTCAITTDHDLYCWGSNADDRLGTGGGNTQVPTQVGEATWSEISTGSAHSCGIRTDGTLWCWGHGGHGRLGVGDFDGREEPTQVGDDNHWVDVSLGNTHSCAITNTNELFCWGQGSWGRLGVGANDNQVTPQPVGTPGWVDLSAGLEHTCALRDDDSLWCWGRGGSGRLGNGLTSTHNIPQLVGFTGWQAFAAGNTFTLGFREEVPSGMSWGDNSEGQLGDDRALSRIPVQVGVP